MRPGTAFRTKGAVAIAFLLFGTSFLFLSAHLTAHQEKVKERVHDVRRIVRSLELPKNLPSRARLPSKGKGILISRGAQPHRFFPYVSDVTNNFDYVFWCGDLNFRLGQTREDVLQWAEQSPIQVDLNSDQLLQLMTDGGSSGVIVEFGGRDVARFSGTCLKSFGEAEITFPPTYKYDPGTQNFDTSSKQRTPGMKKKTPSHRSHTIRIGYPVNKFRHAESLCFSLHRPDPVQSQQFRKY